MKSLAITSKSFSKNPVLRKKVLSIYPDAKFNDEGLIFNNTSLVKFLDGYEVAITALEKINNSVLSKLPKLKIISKYGVGLDMIDLDSMKKNNVQLAWTGGVNKRSVSELVISSAIALLHQSIFANSEVKSGKWYQVIGRQLSECTFGIIGCGNVGKDLVELLKPFNCNILAHDIKNYSDFYLKNKIQSVDLDQLLRKSDVVSLHLQLDSTTQNILSKEKLKLLKKDAILINYARGGLIDETFLKKLMAENKIAGLALDVFEAEPPSDFTFSRLDNVLVTPHIGGSSQEAILAMGMAAIDGLNNAKDPLSFKK